MGRHAFRQVEVSVDGGSVLVHGFSSGLDSAIEQISVAVSDPTDPGRRLAGPATTTPASWGASLAQENLASLVPPRQPFTVGEPVLVVGAALMASGELFAWGGVSAEDGYFVAYEASGRVNPNPSDHDI